MILWLATLIGLALAALPAMMYLRNSPQFRGINDLDSVDLPPRPAVSVLIPARNEADGIEAAIDAALDSRFVDVEVVVLDDHSTDATPDILQRKSQTDWRVRFAPSQPLPDPWNGKQYACRQLADLATHDLFVFLDADVRLSPDGLSRLIAYRNQHHIDLLSAFPRQETGTWLEKAIIPMMHYILLGYLPIDRMRASTEPAYASGCGQLFLTDRTSYHTAGTHEAIAQSRHDGLKLPRAYRTVGLMTDVVDGTDLASCRMYVSATEVIRGVLKNAIEGIAHPRLIVVFSVLLLGAVALPVVTLLIAWVQSRPGPAMVSVIAIVLGNLPRVLAMTQMKQSGWGAIMHIPATLFFVALQWVALANHLTGRSVAWRGRT